MINNITAVLFVVMMIAVVDPSVAGARPSFQLPWSAGTAWGINGGYVYGDEGACGHVGADYYAIDFTLPNNSVVAAAAGGVVITKTTSGGGYGSYLEVDHGAGFVTRYAHLSAFTAGVNIGTYVRPNQDIARSGGHRLTTCIPPPLPRDQERLRLPHGTHVWLLRLRTMGNLD